MKKLILMVLVASAAAIYQPAKAQVSLNINIGAQPTYGYFTEYYARPVPVVVQRNYYTPAPRVVYVKQNNFSKRSYYKPGRRVVSHHYNRPPASYYAVKHVNYKHNKHAAKHGRGHGKGRR